MRLRQGTAVMWREPGVIQVGADPDDHLVLDDLSTQEVSWLMAARLDAALIGPLSPASAHDVRLPPLPAGSRLPGLLRGRGFLRTDEPLAHPLPGGVRLEGIDVTTLAAAQLLVRVGVRRFDLVETGDSGQFDALDKLERGAAAGAHMSERFVFDVLRS